MFRRELNLVICNEESMLSRIPIAIEIKAAFGAFLCVDEWEFVGSINNCN